MVKLWSAYIVAAVFTLSLKLMKYLYEQNKQEITLQKAISEFFLGGNQTAVSSVAILGVEWVFGAIYIDHLTFIFGEALNSVPKHPSIAFLLGSIAEVIAPMGVKALTTRIFPGN